MKFTAFGHAGLALKTFVKLQDIDNIHEIISLRNHVFLLVVSN